MLDYMLVRLRDGDRGLCYFSEAMRACASGPCALRKLKDCFKEIFVR
jgi:hypothetical protein